MIDLLTQFFSGDSAASTGASNMTAIANLPKIETKIISIKDIQVVKPEKGTKVDSVEVNGETIKTQQRFWTSLFSRYGFNNQFFKYFSHDEVFDRIHNTEKKDKIRVCIERSEGRAGRMLAVSNPTKPIADFDDVMELLQRYDGERLTYHNGELSTLHSPRIGGSQLIAGDLFHNKFAVHVPVDGYGQTNIYLAMLRQVCDNGLCAVSKAFRSTLQLGKSDDSVVPTLVRALDSYNNDEGFHALRSRIESSSQSWASVYEASALYKQLIKMHLAEELDAALPEGGYASMVTKLLVDGPKVAPSRYLESERLNEFTPVLSAFHRLTGNTSSLYGIANADDLSIKRQKALPVKCTVYDMVNFATEVSTHHSNPAGQRRLQGWFGTAVSNEYDLEGTVKEFPDFADFHMGQKFGSGVTGSTVGDNFSNLG